MVDGTAIFTLLFGSELFEDYIGHLAVASMASTELTSENDSPEKLQDRMKVCMEVQLNFILVFVVSGH